MLEHLQDFRGITPLGFTKEQMNMLRHDYIPDELDVMPRADLVQNFHKLVTRPRRAEQRTTTIATEGNEMKIAAPIETLQTVAPTSAIYENYYTNDILRKCLRDNKNRKGNLCATHPKWQRDVG